MSYLELSIVSAALFSIGIMVVLTRKNIIMILMGIELMLNGAALNFVAAGIHHKMPQNGTFVLFIIVIAACEIAIALALCIQLYKHFKLNDIDQVIVNQTS